MHRPIGRYRPHTTVQLTLILTLTLILIQSSNLLLFIALLQL